MIMITRRFSLLRQLVWAATLAAGFGTLWLLLAVWLGSSIQEAWQGVNRPPYESLVVRSDGTLLIQSISPENLSQTTYRDLKGQVQEAPDSNDQLPGVSLPGENRPRDFLFFSSRLRWDFRLIPFVDEREPTVNWFFVRDEKPEASGYFVAYERQSNRRVGFIGLAGFRTDPVPRADWIPASGEPKSSAPVSIYSGRAWMFRPDRWDVPPRFVYVPSGNHLRKVDLNARTIAQILETPEPIVAPGVPRITSWSTGRPTKEQHILVRTTQHIHELNLNDRVTRIFSIPTGVDPRSTLEWFEMESGQVIAVFAPPASPRDPDDVSNRLVYRIARDGSIEDQVDLTLRYGSLSPSKQMRAFGVVLVVPAPAILVIVSLLEMISTEQVQSYGSFLTARLKDSWPSLIAVLAFSLILAVMAWRRSRAFGRSRRETSMWAAFVLLFGLPAYAGFRLHRRWPIRLSCPHCHVWVPRDRPVCAECGSGFPAPALKGTEIFA